MVEYSNLIKLGSKYIVYMNKKLGKGGFGEIFLGANIKTSTDVAVKMETLKIKHQQLHHETRVLKDLQGGIGIPIIYYFHQLSDYNCLVMEQLGKSLEGCFIQCNRKFTMKTVLMLGHQMLERIEYMHSRGIIHRDVKPDNFLMGSNENQSVVYVIDMGLSKRFIDPNTGEHIPFKEGKTLTGTVRYASIFTHQGMEQSRRDDLEGLCYVLIYFLRGELPWQGQRAKSKKEKYQKIMNIKVGTTIEKLCYNIPVVFSELLRYVRKLKFTEKPDYYLLKELFNKEMDKEKCDFDYKFDWMPDDFGMKNKSVDLTMNKKDNAQEQYFKEDANLHAIPTQER